MGNTQDNRSMQLEQIAEECGTLYNEIRGEYKGTSQILDDLESLGHKLKWISRHAEALTSPDEDVIQDRVDEIRQKIDEARTRMDSVEEEAENILGHIERSDEQIKKAENQINQVEEQIKKESSG